MLREVTGSPAEPMEEATITSTNASARAALGDTVFATAWSAGRAMPLEEAVAMALNQAVVQTPIPEPPQLDPGTSRPRLPDGLTPREAEVLALIAGGSTNREIAEILVISLGTVERHIANFYTKINARGRADATAYALRHNLLTNDR
jgi:DNA-binding NarL/FixJ family response regulator